MREFWNHKSKNYPTAKDEDGLKTPIKVIEQLKLFGVDFRDKTILDIGCGTGLYSSLLAKEGAKRVLGVDISIGMISKLRDYIKEFDIKNIDTRELDFREFESEEKFDIVFSAMTPAISSRDDLLAMMRLSSDIAIYIGFAGKRESPLMDKILENFGLKYEIKDGFLTTKKILEELGYEVKEAFFEHNWSQVGTLQESAIDVIEHLKVRGFEANIDDVKKSLEQYLVDGLIKRDTFSKIGVMYWRVK